jgi:uncharacterized RDD family membrane protein YckC
MPESPTILRLYLSTVIDGVLILSTFIAVSFAVNSDSSIASYARIAVLAIMLFLYEPVMTSRCCTLGQKISGIRVRKIDSYGNISIPAAYLRIVIKIVLGFISLLSIPCTRDRRAIHDFVSGSIVVMA